MSAIAQRYQDYAEHHRIAYDTFRETYARQKPPPALVPFDQPAPIARAGWHGWLANVSVMTIALAVMTSAAVIVSGSRTIIEFGGGLLGWSAFVMLELSIIAYSYRESLINAKRAPARPVVTRRRILANVSPGAAGMYGAFAVTLVANLHATLKANGIEVAEWLDTAILVMIAISAPTLALISGHLFGHEAVEAQKRKAEYQATFVLALAEWRAAKAAHDAVQEARMTEWEDGLNRAFNGKKGEMGVRIEKEEPAQLPSTRLSAQTDDADRQAMSSALPPSTQTDARRTGYGYARQSDGQQLVMEHLNQHPEDAELGYRELGDRVGVGKDTAGKALKAWRAQQTTEVQL